VSWAYAPDYVSWCPLGWNNAAVFSIGYYNVGPAYYSSHYHGHYYSAWTTVRHHDFGHGDAHQHAVNFDRGYAGMRPQFTEGRRTADPAFASARATAAPIHNGGTRVASPRYVNRGDDIVRSQTARPIPPRDTAVARTAPAPNSSPGVYAQRPMRAWDNPAYRPPNYNPSPSRTAPAYSAPASSAPAYRPPAYSAPVYPAPGRTSERAMPRAEPPPQAPRFEPAPRPQGNGYARPAAPSGGEHAAPRSSPGGAAAGGGHVETHAPQGAGVARGRSR
jgi:hypothetical protein